MYISNQVLAERIRAKLEAKTGQQLPLDGVLHWVKLVGSEMKMAISEGAEVHLSGKMCISKEGVAGKSKAESTTGVPNPPTPLQIRKRLSNLSSKHRAVGRVSAEILAGREEEYQKLGATLNDSELKSVMEHISLVLEKKLTQKSNRTNALLRKYFETTCPKWNREHFIARISGSFLSPLIGSRSGKLLTDRQVEQMTSLPETEWAERLDVIDPFLGCGAGEAREQLRTKHFEKTGQWLSAHRFTTEGSIMSQVVNGGGVEFNTTLEPEHILRISNKGHPYPDKWIYPAITDFPHFYTFVLKRIEDFYTQKPELTVALP